MNSVEKRVLWSLARYSNIIGHRLVIGGYEKQCLVSFQYSFVL